MKNQVQLCTYVDRFGKGDLRHLGKILNTKFKHIFGGVHLLPFYDPIDGADAGFDPIDHTCVDARLGTWEEVKALSQTHEILADVIVNHMSSKSESFLDYLQHGEQSQYADLFLNFDKVFTGGATEKDILSLYRPRDGLPFTKIKFNNGSEKLLWTTFTAEQIDIDVFSTSGKQYLSSILQHLQSAQVKMIRLDAAGYAVKKAGSSCFMIEETFAFIDEFTRQAREAGMEVLVEIHSHYLTQVAIAKKTSWVYDFALPPLLLHTLIFRDSEPLQRWYDIAPHNAINVLDTHDGIGIIDVAQDSVAGPGLLDAHQIDRLVEAIHTNSGDTSRKATGKAASNLDLYQVNCTYFEALGKDEQAYLLARLIQVFSPGIPQVYYVGLLAGENDMALLKESGVGRDINRHYYSEAEIDSALQRPVVQTLLAIFRFRNQRSLFTKGSFSCTPSGKTELHMAWATEHDRLSLVVDLSQLSFTITEKLDGNVLHMASWQDFITGLDAT